MHTPFIPYSHPIHRLHPIRPLPPLRFPRWSASAVEAERRREPTTPHSPFTPLQFTPHTTFTPLRFTPDSYRPVHLHSHPFIHTQVSEVERLCSLVEAERRREPTTVMHSQLSQLKSMARKKARGDWVRDWGRGWPPRSSLCPVRSSQCVHQPLHTILGSRLAQFSQLKGVARKKTRGIRVRGTARAGSGAGSG